MNTDLLRYTLGKNGGPAKYHLVKQSKYSCIWPFVLCNKHIYF